MSNPNAPAAPRWFVALGVVGLAAYAIFLAHNSTIVAGGSDSSGYLNDARLLAAGHLQTELRAPAEFGPPAGLNRANFIPQGFYAYDNNPHLTPTYPVGLPLHFAVAGKFLGWVAGPLLVELVAAVGALALCYATGREFGLEPAMAGAAAAMLGLFPVFVFTSTQPLSDTLATAWCLAAIWAALRARRHRGWAAATGAALAIAVLVRPTNIVLLPALAVLLGLDLRKLALAAAAALPGAIWLLYYNRLLYGNALSTGYGPLNDAFALSYGPPTLWHFIRWLALLLPTPLLLLPLAAAIGHLVSRRKLIALALWFGSMVGLYAFYTVSHETWWCLRFILPALPAGLIAGMLGLQALAHRAAGLGFRYFNAIALGLLVVWSAGASWYWNTTLGVFFMRKDEQVYADACSAARDRLPGNALLVCCYTSGAIYYYTDFAVLRWDQLEPAQFARYAALARQAGRPIGALIYAMEDKDALQSHCPGTWSRLGQVGNIGLWQLQAPAAAPVRE